MEAADGLFGFESAIEADPREHHGGDGAFYDLAFGELCSDLIAGVAEFEGIKGGPFGRGAGWFFVIGVFLFGRVIGTEPGLIIGVEFFDREGEDATAPPQGDQLAIVGDVGCFEGLITGGIFPFSGREGRNCEKEGGEKRENTHDTGA